MSENRLALAAALALLLSGLGCQFIASLLSDQEAVVSTPPPTIAEQPRPTRQPPAPAAPTELPPATPGTRGRRTIGLGETATASLPSPEAVDSWVYDSPGDEHITVDVVNLGDWDPTLEILSEAGETVAYDDDSGDGRNPRVVGLYLHTPGRYELTVFAFSGYGDYRIHLRRTDAPGGGSLIYGQSVRSVLEEGEREYWTFQGAAGDSIRISMAGLGDLTDTYLELYDAEWDLVTFDDDSGELFSALIEDYSLPATSTYWILARGFGGAGGEYQLTLEKVP